MDIGLVSCTKKKSDEPNIPKELYVESTLFRKARRYCEQFHADWYILSAKYGLLEPDGPKIDPYDVTLSEYNADERKTWGDDVASELRRRSLTDERLVIHAGRDYYEPLLNALTDVTYEIPTKGLRYGESLSWYNNSMENS